MLRQCGFRDRCTQHANEPGAVLRTLPGNYFREECDLHRIRQRVQDCLDWNIFNGGMEERFHYRTAAGSSG